MQITREKLCERLADAMCDAVDMDALISAFYSSNFDFYYREADMAKLHEDAVDLGLIDDDEDLILI